MAKIFLSYSRRSEAIAKALAADIEALGHSVWFDEELSGGHPWWNQILAKIRESDVFVLVLDLEALNSTACRREFTYAADLGKPIVPALVAEGVSTNLLPPALSAIQFVDYRTQDRRAALRLAKALSAVPPAGSLPDPLPAAPEAPVSYLTSLSDLVEAPSDLSYEQQVALVFDLKRGLRDPETANDTRTLLVRLRRRRDLFASIDDEIEELLTRPSNSSPIDPEPMMHPDDGPTSVQTRSQPAGEIGRAALVGTPPGAGVKARAPARKFMGPPVRWQLLAAALAVVAIGVATYLLRPPRDLVDLPVVRGLSELEARSRLEAACIPMPCFDVTVRAQADAVVDESLAMATEPAKSATRRSAVTLVVSSGPGRVAVPAVRGDNLVAGVSKINALGLLVGPNAVLQPSTDVAIDRLVGTRPDAGDLVLRGSEVQLVVSTGPRQPRCVPWPTCVQVNFDARRFMTSLPGLDPVLPIEEFVVVEGGDIVMQLEQLRIPEFNVLPLP